MKDEEFHHGVAWVPCIPEFLKKGQTVMHHELGRCEIFEVFLDRWKPCGVALDPLNEEGKSKNNDGSIFLTPDDSGVFHKVKGPVYFHETDFTQFLCDPWDRAFPTP